MTQLEQLYLLLVAGDLVCDLYEDKTRARIDMRRDCATTPPHLRADLLDHFSSITKATAEISAAALDDDPPSFGASIAPFTGPPGDSSSTGNSNPALSPFRNQPRGVM